MMGLAALSARGGRLEEAESRYREILRAHPGPQPVLYYNLACLYALKGETEASLDWLRRAVEAGYRNLAALRGDPDLAGIRETEAFKKILESIAPEKVSPSPGKTLLKNDQP